MELETARRTVMLRPSVVSMVDRESKTVLLVFVALSLGKLTEHLVASSSAKVTNLVLKFLWLGL